VESLTLLLDAKNELGEGPVWDVEDQAIYWVDIMRPSVHRLVLASAAHTEWRMPKAVGCLALRRAGGALVALADGFYSLDLESGEVNPCHQLPEPEVGGRLRFNDGKCDRIGRFWAGTADGVQKDYVVPGALYRYDPDGTCRAVLRDVGNPNGIGWSPDNTTMYFADTLARQILAFDFDLPTGALANRRLFAQDGPKDGCPDGLTVDSEGCVWSAKWDGWKVVRYSPKGDIVSQIRMPVPRPTSCVFGGPDLCQLIITSARMWLSDKELREAPNSGGLFIADVGISGVAEPRFLG
jgi:sugar lactone lactonase YvrE